MAHYDVFNGDADGICALTQLHLAQPRASTLVTGVKRDIQLLQRVQAAAGDAVTVLDISLDKNRESLRGVLDAGAEVFYVDHHKASDIPDSDRLTTIINEAPDVCTAMLINGHLKNRYPGWAVVGAFGDNLDTSAEGLARQLDLSADELRQLRDLGIYMNYNGYGEKVEDLLFSPEELFRQVSGYPTPFAFMADAADVFDTLRDGYHSDMGKAESTQPEPGSSEHAALFILPNEAWARRVSGVYSNDLCQRYPGRAHAVLIEKPDNTYLISVRAPLDRKEGAGDLCSRFPTGGGRAAAAGINALPADQLDEFAQAFAAQFEP